MKKPIIYVVVLVVVVIVIVVAMAGKKEAAPEQTDGPGVLQQEYRLTYQSMQEALTDAYNQQLPPGMSMDDILSAYGGLGLQDTGKVAQVDATPGARPVVYVDMDDDGEPEVEIEIASGDANVAGGDTVTFRGKINSFDFRPGAELRLMLRGSVQAGQ